MTRFKLAAGDTFRSLQHRNFRLYFCAQAVSFTGTWLQLIAQSLLVLRLTDSGTALGLLAGLQFAPTLLLGAWAGVVIDRHDKRRLMQVTTTVMAVAATALGVLVLTDRVTLTWVYALAALLGLANTFDNPARRTLVSELVPEDHVANAVSLNSTLVTMARLLGPALAGLLVASVGIGWCFVLNGVSFAAPFVAVWALDTSSMRTTAPVARERGQLRAGLRYARSVPEIAFTLLLMTVIGTLGFNTQIWLLLLAERRLAGGSGLFAWLSVSGSVGMLLGSLWLARRRSIGPMLLGVSATALGLATFLLAAAPNVATAIPASFLVGLAGIFVLSGANTVLQLTAEPAMRGRVLALYTLVVLGSTPIGGPLMGYIAEHAGVQASIATGGAASLIAGLAGLAHLRRTAGVVAVAEAAPPRPEVAVAA